MDLNMSDHDGSSMLLAYSNIAAPSEIQVKVEPDSNTVPRWPGPTAHPSTMQHVQSSCLWKDDTLGTHERGGEMETFNNPPKTIVIVPHSQGSVPEYQVLEEHFKHWEQMEHIEPMESLESLPPEGGLTSVIGTIKEEKQDLTYSNEDDQSKRPKRSKLIEDKSRRCQRKRKAKQKQDFTSTNCNNHRERPTKRKKKEQQDCVFRNEDIQSNSQKNNKIQDAKLKGKGKTLAQTNKKKHHQCHTCGENLKNLKLLKNHIPECFWTILKEEKDEVQCLLCKNKYTRKEEFLRHFEGHTGVKQFWCVQCGSAFKTSRDFKDHMDVHVDKKEIKFQCDSCHLCFASKSHLTEHTNISHRKEEHQNDRDSEVWANDDKWIISRRQFLCNICNMVFKTGSNLRVHMDVHVELKDYTFECDICSRNFPSKECLYKHKVVHKGKIIQSVLLKELERKFICNVCGKGFKRKNNMREHMDVHVERKDYKFQCGECLIMFPSKERLYKHHTRKHKIDLKVTPPRELPRTHICNVCGKGFKRSSNLKGHMDVHVEKKDYKFQCNICASLFASKERLYKHVTMTHNRENRTSSYKYQCQYCQKTFPTKFRLQKHEIKHLNSKYLCPVCNAPFTSEKSFKRHTIMHVKGFPFICVLCQNGFKTRAHLRAHRQSHTSGDSVDCEACIEGAKDKEGYEKHSCIHIDNTTCDICFQSFSGERDFELHMTTHANFCEICSTNFVTAKVYMDHFALHGEEEFIGEEINCGICKKEYSSYKTLKRHMESHLKSFSCNICDRKFNSKPVYEKHLKKHDDEESMGKSDSDGETEDVHEEGSGKIKTDWKVKIKEEIEDSDEEWYKYPPPEMDMVNIGGALKEKVGTKMVH